MFERAIAAQNCVFLGKLRHDKHLFYHGVQLYNSAIRYLSHILSRSRNVYSDEVVYTATLFQALVVSTS
jgi:hypothetical protein